LHKIKSTYLNFIPNNELVYCNFTMEKDNTTYKLPIGWVEVEIQDVTIISTGCTPSKRRSNYYGGSYPFYKPSDLNAGFVYKAQEHLSMEGKNVARILPTDSILVTSIGSTIGKAGLIKKEGAFNQQINGIIPLISLPLFYYYQIIDSSFQRKLIGNSSATTVPIINKSKFGKLSLKLAPLEEQQRIVSKIEKLFSELNHAEKELQKGKHQLEICRQALLKNAFTGKLLSKDSELKYNWRRINLGDVIIKSSHKAKPDNNSELKFIGLECINANSLKLKSAYLFKNYSSSANYFKKGDILYSRMRPNLNKVYKTEFDGVCSGEFFVLEVLEIINTDFLKYLLHSSEFVRYATKKAAGDRPRLSFKDFCNYQFYIPKIEEQNLIVQEIESRITLMENLNDSITTGLKKIVTFQDAILKKAFEGSLLPQNSNDESAVDLLTRIRVEKTAFLESQKKALINSPKMKTAIDNKKTILEILTGLDSPISAHDLWQQSIYNEDIEEFYAELKKNDNKIEEIRIGMDIKLKLKP